MFKTTIYIVILSLVSSALYAILAFPPDNLHIFMCSVGQGDSILIQRAFFQVIVDGGPGSGLLECLGRYKPFWDRKIEVIILTHPDLDHYGGLVELLRRYEVEVFIANGLGSDSQEFVELVDLLKQQKPNLIQPSSGTTLSLPENMKMKFLWPEQKMGDLHRLVETASEGQASMEGEDFNQVSLVFEFSFNEFNMLFTGDIGLYEELALDSQGLLTDTEILKIPHHGSKYSSSMGFLRSVSPQVSLISSGRNNRYGHPHPDVLSRLQQIKSRVYRTDLHGDIEIITNGRDYQIKP